MCMIYLEIIYYFLYAHKIDKKAAVLKLPIFMVINLTFEHYILINNLYNIVEYIFLPLACRN